MNAVGTDCRDETLTCSRCKRPLPPEAFNVNNARPSHRQCACKACLQRKREAKAAKAREYAGVQRQRLTAAIGERPTVTVENVIYPLDCVGCPRLLFERAQGKRWMGCDAGVFVNVIDVARFRRIEAHAKAPSGLQRGGFGGVPMRGLPAKWCRVRHEVCEIYGDVT